MKTLEDAYVEGFCKAAEAYGVDPEALYKAAFPIGALMKGVGAASKAVGRVGKAGKQLGRAASGIRKGLGRSIGGLSGGPGFSRALGNAGRAAKGFGTSLGGLAKGVGLDAAQLGRNAGTLGRQGVQAAGRATMAAGRRAGQATMAAGRRGAAMAQKGYQNTNTFLRNNPLAGIAAGGALGFGAAKLSGGNGNAQPQTPYMARNNNVSVSDSAGDYL